MHRFAIWMAAQGMQPTEARRQWHVLISDYCTVILRSNMYLLVSAMLRSNSTNSQVLKYLRKERFSPSNAIEQLPRH